MSAPAQLEELEEETAKREWRSVQRQILRSKSKRRHPAYDQPLGDEEPQPPCSSNPCSPAPKQLHVAAVELSLSSSPGVFEGDDPYYSAEEERDEGQESDEESPSCLDSSDSEEEEGPQLDELPTPDELKAYHLQHQPEHQPAAATNSDAGPFGPSLADVRRNNAHQARPYLMQRYLELIVPCKTHAPNDGLCVQCEGDSPGEIMVYCKGCERYLCSSCDLHMHRQQGRVLHNRVALLEDGGYVAMDHRSVVQGGVITRLPEPNAGVDSHLVRPLPYNTLCSECRCCEWSQVPVGGGKPMTFIDEEGDPPLPRVPISPCRLEYLQMADHIPHTLAQNMPFFLLRTTSPGRG